MERSAAGFVPVSGCSGQSVPAQRSSRAAQRPFPSSIPVVLDHNVQDAPFRVAARTNRTSSRFELTPEV